MHKETHVFDEMVSQSHIWLNDINNAIGGAESDGFALQALRASLHLLRDQLTVDQNAHLSAQLPTIIRGIYYDEWVPAKTPARQRHEEQFLDRLNGFSCGGATEADPKDILRAVFSVLRRHISPGEGDKIYHVLSAALKKYWDQEAK